MSHPPPPTPPLTGITFNEVRHAEREYQLTQARDPTNKLYLIRVRDPPPAHKREASCMNLFLIRVVGSDPMGSEGGGGEEGGIHNVRGVAGRERGGDG